MTAIPRRDLAQRGLLVLLTLVATTVATYTQHEEHRPSVTSQPALPPAPKLGWEPIRCWRQTSAGAITIGEMFTMVITCAAYEGDNAQVIPDEARLGVASIQLAPFEILGGSHRPDVRRGTRRFFQYDYQLRLISADAIGHDVNLPPLTISYRIHSRVGAAATLEGRDLSYVLPMMPIKVLSMVPADAADIRDASDASLATVESLRVRSATFRALAWTCGALAFVAAIFALVPVARRSGAIDGAQPHRVPEWAILRRAADDLADVQARAARDGWDDEAVARALGSARLVAAAGIDQPIRQRVLTKAGESVEGRLPVPHGLIRTTTVAVTSAVTSDAVSRARRNTPELSTVRHQQLATLEAALATLTASLYQRAPTRDAATLDEAVRDALNVARAMAADRRTWRSILRGSRGRT